MAVARQRLVLEEDLAPRRSAAGGHLNELDRPVGVAEGLGDAPEMNAAQGRSAAAEQNDRNDQGPGHPRSRSHCVLPPKENRFRSAEGTPLGAHRFRAWRHGSWDLLFYTARSSRCKPESAGYTEITWCPKSPWRVR